MNADEFLSLPTQQRLVCCGIFPASLTNPKTSKPCPNELITFTRILTSSPTDAANLTESKTTALKSTRHVVEVIRCAWTGKRKDAVQVATDFVPSIVENDKYVEVHVKDAFGGRNPAGLKENDNLVFNQFQCERHPFREGRAFRDLDLIVNPLYGKSIDFVPRPAGVWLKCGRVEKWGEVRKWEEGKGHDILPL